MKRKRLKDDQRKVNRYLRSVNKSLLEDNVYKGRFQVKQVGRRDYVSANWSCGRPSWLGLYERNDDIDNACYCETRYIIELIDNKMPERNIHCSYNMLNNHLVNGYSNDYEKCMTKSEEWVSSNVYPFGNYLFNALNEFIQQSGVWEEYANMRRISKKGS